MKKYFLSFAILLFALSSSIVFIGCSKGETWLDVRSVAFNGLTLDSRFQILLEEPTFGDYDWNQVEPRLPSFNETGKLDANRKAINSHSPSVEHPMYALSVGETFYGSGTSGTWGIFESVFLGIEYHYISIRHEGDRTYIRDIDGSVQSVYTSLVHIHYFN